jgi:hypothetical protein
MKRKYSSLNFTQTPDCVVGIPTHLHLTPSSSHARFTAMSEFLSRLAPNICGSNQDASVQVVAIVYFRSVSIFSDASPYKIRWGGQTTGPCAWKMVGVKDKKDVQRPLRTLRGIFTSKRISILSRKSACWSPPRGFAIRYKISIFPENFCSKS